MSKAEEFVQDYRQGGSQKVWGDPSEMSLIEKYEYLVHCKAARDRYQGMLYAWATQPELRDVPTSEIQCVVEDVQFLAGQIESLSDELNKPLTLVNADGFFLYNAALTLQQLRLGYKRDDSVVEELVNYWYLLLEDNKWVFEEE